MNTLLFMPSTESCLRYLRAPSDYHHLLKKCRVKPCKGGELNNDSLSQRTASLFNLGLEDCAIFQFVKRHHVWNCGNESLSTDSWGRNKREHNSKTHSKGSCVKHAKGLVTRTRGILETEKPRQPAYQKHGTDVYLRTDGNKAWQLRVSSDGLLFLWVFVCSAIWTDNYRIQMQGEQVALLSVSSNSKDIMV